MTPTWFPIRHSAGMGWRRDTPDKRDLYLAYPQIARRLPKRVDVSGVFGDFPVYDQGALGSCTANAIAAAVVFLERKVGAVDKTQTMPSRLFIYYCERLIEGSVNDDAGAELRDGMKVVQKLGYPDEELWPYVVSRFARRPPPAIFEKAKADHVLRYYRVGQRLQSMRLCLAHGYPFVAGFSVYTSMWGNDVRATGNVPMPGDRDRLEGGHAILVTGYDDEAQRFTIRNSWAASWGRFGYGTLPYEYLTDPDLAGDFWTARRETTA